VHCDLIQYYLELFGIRVVNSIAIFIIFKNETWGISIMVYVNSHYPFERFASIRRYTSFNFLARDPSWIIYIADTNSQFNLWRQRSHLSYEGEPYAPNQLTSFVDDSVRAVFTSPTDDVVVFFADHQGIENFQIYRMEAFNGWPEAITQNSKVRHEWGAECFSRDGQKIAYSSNEQDPSDMLIYVRNLQKDETICITTKPGWYIPGYWSRDNRKMNCSQLVTLTDFAIWLLDIEDRRMLKITPTKEKSRYIVGPWSYDGQGFYISTDLNREHMGLAFYDINYSKLEWILTPDSDIEAIDLSKNGKVLAWSINLDGYSRLYIKNLDTEEIQEVLKIPKGVIGKLKISLDGRKIGFLMTTPTSPFNIYIIDLESQKTERLTNALFGNIPEEIMIEPESIRYKSFDNLAIPTLLYKPKNASGVNKVGAVLSIHGGPMDQERPTYAYAGLYQFLARRGLAILAPNFRGSTGYGKSFERKIYHDWGGNELKDLEYGARWLLEQNWIDSNKLAVFGASYGGFAALSCVTRLPQYGWRAAVDIVGPSNLVTFTKSVPQHWKRFMAEIVGDPEREEDFLKVRSPLTYVDNIKTHLLIIQGVNDPRVVKGESDQMVERLRSLGRDVEYLVFEDEGHGFTKYNNMIKALKASSEFLAKSLE